MTTSPAASPPRHSKPLGLQGRLVELHGHVDGAARSDLELRHDGPPSAPRQCRGANAGSVELRLVHHRKRGQIGQGTGGCPTRRFRRGARTHRGPERPVTSSPASSPTARLEARASTGWRLTHPVSPGRPPVSGAAPDRCRTCRITSGASSGGGSTSPTSDRAWPTPRSARWLAASSGSRVESLLELCGLGSVHLPVQLAVEQLPVRGGEGHAGALRQQLAQTLASLVEP